MSLIDGNIKDVLSIKLKCRHDGITDQFNRILMVKMLIIFSIIMSMEFFSDKVSCIIPYEGKDVTEVHLLLVQPEESQWQTVVTF